MLHQSAKTIVRRKLNQLPVQACVMVPFVLLAKFAAHENQLFAGVTIHPCQKHSEIGELLPFVTGHFGQQRSLPVHHFIVTENQNEILLKRIKQRERNIAVMETPKNRIETHVLQEIVHPTHVPFEPESEAAEISGPRYTGPRSRFLRNRHNSWETFVTDFVETLQEKDGVQVFATTV